MSREVRQRHHYGYRSGEWATIVGEIDHPGGHRCWVVRFPDGMSDFWPVDDSVADYEIRSGGGNPQ